MQGDFLGEASVAWEDLEIGREMDLTLVRRKDVEGGSVKGTIKVLVGEPVVELVEVEQGLAVDAAPAAVDSQQSASRVTVEKQQTGGVTIEKEVGVLYKKGSCNMAVKQVYNPLSQRRAVVFAPCV